MLTAAHCFSNIRENEWRSGNKIDVRIGQTDISKDESSGTSANIANVKVSEFCQEVDHFLDHCPCLVPDLFLSCH